MNALPRLDKHSTTLAVLPLKSTLDLIRNGVTCVNVAGAKEVNLKRLTQFTIHGCKCFNCGIEGNAVLVSKDKGGGNHADVVRIEGLHAILMNRDHIKPASKGGTNSVWNMRPACGKCNSKRGNNYTDDDKKQFSFQSKWQSIHDKMWLKKSRFRNLMDHFIDAEMQLHISKSIARVSLWIFDPHRSNKRVSVI